MLAHLAQRVDRIRVTTALDLDGADVETRIAGDGAPAHLESVVGRCHFLPALEHRRACRHEQNRIEAELLGNFCGHVQMPVVNGVERAAHDAELHRRPIGPQVVESLADQGHYARTCPSPAMMYL